MFPRIGEVGPFLGRRAVSSICSADRFSGESKRLLYPVASPEEFAIDREARRTKEAERLGSFGLSAQPILRCVAHGVFECEFRVFEFRRKIGQQVYATATGSGDFADEYDESATHIGVWKEVLGNRGMLEKEPWAYARGHMTASNSPLKHYDFPLPRVVERMSDCIFIDHILVSVRVGKGCERLTF